MSGPYNTKGPVKGEVATSGKPASAANPPVEDKNLLESAKDATLNVIDEWVEKQGDSTTAMVAGAAATVLVEVFMPTAYWELIPAGKAIKLVKKSGEAIGVLKKGEQAVEAGKNIKNAEKTTAAEQKGAAKTTKNAKGDAQIKTGKKRKPKRRCELVPYDELECSPGQEAHHVVPDWLLRLGKRGGSERVPDMPSLRKGPAICLDKGAGEEHSAAHKNNDRMVERVGKNGKSTGVKGTIKLGQAKAISARSIAKATAPQKGGEGCTKEDIKKQLDEQFKGHDDTLLRAVRDARKVTDDIKNVLNGGKD